METVIKPAAASRARWRWPAAPLRSYLVAMTLLATVPMAALMSVWIFNDMKQQQAGLEALLRRSATAVARAVERELHSSIDALTLLSRRESLQGGDLAQFRRELLARRLLRPQWGSVFVAERDGRVLFDVGGAPAPDTGRAAPRLDTIASLPEFQRLVDGGDAMVSSLVGGNGSNHATAVAVPVLADGALRYVLGAWIDAALWQRLLDEQTVEPADGVRVLFDHQRRFIARAPERSSGRNLPDLATEPMATRATGFMRTELPLEGGALYAAWHGVAPAGWGAAVGVAAAPVDAAQRNAVLAAVSTTAGCVLLGVSLALLFARRVTQPLEQLATHGAASRREPIPVQEVSRLRDALVAAQAQDEVTRERSQKKADEFETLFASSPLGLAFAMDPECRQVLHNPAMTELFGPPAGAGAAAAVEVRHLGQPLPRTQQPLQRAAAHGETVTAVELELRAEGQPPRFVIASAVPLRDQDGRARGAIGAVVDISERKQVEARLLDIDQRLRNSQHLMELAQEAGEVGFFHYRFAADQLAWTPGLAKLFGFDATPAQTKLADWAHRIDADDRARAEAGLRRMFEHRQERETFDFRVAASDAGSEPRWLSSRVLISYAADGTPQQAVGISVDVSESKRAEQERAALIEREQAARRDAESANRAKDEFLAMLGHELRNPLSAISSAVEVLNRVGSGSDTAVEARNIIARQTRHLAYMMEDLLDVARVISGKVGLSRHPLELSALVQRVLATLELTGAARQHRLEAALEPAVWIDADATRIDQVVNNLLTNALKYTPAGGRITVEVARDADGDGGVARLVVRDTGPGIPSALLPRVFDLFVQGERTLDRRAGGLGLGLTLVRRLVELHGGAVGASSSDAGSAFTVLLPALPPPDASVARETQPQWLPESRRRRITLIEDNEDARESLRALLELDGHSVSTAGDGSSGLQAVLQSRPDVAVVDIGLPGITGFEVARRCRGAGYAGRMIALSGYGQQHDIAEALAAGFDAHLVKPVDPAELQRLLVED